MSKASVKAEMRTSEALRAEATANEMLMNKANQKTEPLRRLFAKGKVPARAETMI